MRHLGLGIALYAFWLALSGHYTPFLLSVGLLCSALCVFLADRLGILDEEGMPTHMIGGSFAYWGWLIVEIIKSGICVTRIILSPSLPISPTMTKVRASQKTAAGMATYANSITLTPGTITTGVDGDVFTVHAIQASGADDLEAGGMDAKVSAFEGGNR